MALFIIQSLTHQPVPTDREGCQAATPRLHLGEHRYPGAPQRWA